jgi:hypothetical protein
MAVLAVEPLFVDGGHRLELGAARRDGREDRVAHGGGRQVLADPVVVHARVGDHHVRAAVGRLVLGPDVVVERDDVAEVRRVEPGLDPRGHLERPGDEILDLPHRERRPDRDEQR